MEHVNIIEMLAARYLVDQQAGNQFSADTEIYKELIKVLPQAFPLPDRIYTKSCGLTAYDACLVYIIKEGEKTEPIKMLLSMLFGAQEWTAILDKDDPESFILSTILQKPNIIFNLTITASLDDYFYTATEDKGTYTKGIAIPKRFTPYEITRMDVTPSIIYQVQVDTGLSKTVINWWLDLLTRLISTIDISLPIPNEIMGAFGSDHDIDFIYFQDPEGRIRDIFTGLYTTEWYYYFIKADGTGKLATKITVDEAIIHVVINNPKVFGTVMTLEEETPEYIQYRAIQETDPDYFTHLLDYYDNLDPN